MTRREYILVFATILVGLVPAIAAYTYLDAHPSAISSIVSGMVPDVARGPELSATALLAVTRERVTVYQSRPQKETALLCSHSYYTSFVLTIAASHTASLTKHCESVRDTSATWYGTVSTTATSTTARDGEEQIITFDRSTTREALEPHTIRISRTDDEIHILESTLSEIATSTVFIVVPSQL